MLIETLEIEGVGPIRERLSLGPLQPGLNILAQSNEWGKSTVVQALGRALFDRYSSASEEIRQLRPAGTSLSPGIELVFSTGVERYRLVKRFLDRKSSELFRGNGLQWERIAESDRADHRVRELLGAPVLDGRTAKPETWGLLRYLWARQDDPCCWPGWDGESGTAARRRLAAVEIDPIVHSLAAPLLAKAAAVFAHRGKVRAAGPLAAAESEQARIKAELLTIQEQRSALEQLEEYYQRVAHEVPVLNQERERLRVEASRSQAAAVEFQRQANTVRALQADLVRAEAALHSVRQDAAVLEETAESLRSKSADQAKLQREVALLDERMLGLEHTFLKAQSGLRENAAARAELEQALQLVRERIRQAILEAESKRQRVVLKQAQAAARDLERLEQKEVLLGSVTPTQVQRWRELAVQIREDVVRLESLGLAVELESLTDGHVQVVADGTESRFKLQSGQARAVHAADALSLSLPGWGMIRVTSGAREAAGLKIERDRRSAELKQALNAVGVKTVAEADVLLEQIRENKSAIELARRMLAAQLGEWKSLAEFQSALAAREAMLSGHASHALSQVVLEAEEAELVGRLAGSRVAEGHAVAALETARIAIEAARQQREEYSTQVATLEARAKGLQEQQRMLGSRYDKGLPESLRHAQEHFVRAEARHAEAARQLPLEAERFPERSQRAARAAAEADAAWQQASYELRHLEGQLEERGGQPMYARESELQEMLPVVTAEAARLRREGLAARLAAALIEKRERSAVRTVLKPLEDRLTEVFSELTGIRSRRVWFDEHLQVRGVGTREDELVGFDQLSRGAREQLLLALRAAIALELAADGPQCLVLDDVLVHTDSVRHQNVLDYLEQLSTRVQVLLLTCHADRYRGLGHLLTPVVSTSQAGS